MTEAIFRDDAYAKSCEATVVSVDKAGIELDRRVLAELAISDPQAFGSVVEAARAAL